MYMSHELFWLTVYKYVPNVMYKSHELRVCVMHCVNDCWPRSVCFCATWTIAQVYLRHELCIRVTNYAYTSRTMYMTADTWLVVLLRDVDYFTQVYMSHELCTSVMNYVYESRTMYIPAHSARRRWANEYECESRTVYMTMYLFVSRIHSHNTILMCSESVEGATEYEYKCESRTMYMTLSICSCFIFTVIL